MINPEKTIFKHQDAIITIKQLNQKKLKINVRPNNKNLFIPFKTCETSYSLELIKKILDIKGPAYLCDEILRDESTEYLQKSLKYCLLGYIKKKEFTNKRILDFGCGSGSSSMILSKMFPDTQIVGIDLEKKLLQIARTRAKHYNFKNVSFLASPDPNSLPKKIGKFDYILLSAVFEHMLPNERNILLPKIWTLLKTNGIIFINRTPYRYFPFETHTTGLPIINYLPDKLCCLIARKFSKRNLQKDNWQVLLRKGIRGTSSKEIMKILQKKCDQKPLLLSPSHLGLKDNIDLWHMQTNTKNKNRLKKILFYFLKFLHYTTGTSLTPSISLAIKKLT